MMMDSFWKDKRVFLTGHTGFKGCWLLLLLESLGARVLGYALHPQKESLYQSVFSGVEPHGVFADIRDRDRLEREMSAFKPDVVMHLAAQPLVRESYREPALTYETNVMGTVNVLEAVRSAGGVRSCVVITTDKCYRDQNWEWGYRETDPLGGADPYSSSKACAELVCDAWRSSYFLKTDTLLATARAGNVIGGGDWAADRLVPDAMRAFLKGHSLTIRSPKAVRPWQHVLEPLTGYLLLARRLFEGDATCATSWNFGPSAKGACDVQSVVARLVQLWGDGASFQVIEDDSMHESFLLRLDSSRAIQKLGWNPRLTVDTALDMTVSWYRRALETSPLSITMEQIEAYGELEG